MKITAILTEKSLADASDGTYTFYVPRNSTKSQIKDSLSQIFGVTVKTVRTINLKGGKKRGINGRIRTIKSRKKAFVTLSGKETIKLFDTKK